MISTRFSFLVFDVNGTLSNVAALRGRFADVGARTQLADVWFASVLRDGFALTAAGGKRDFATIARGVLAMLLSGEIEAERVDAAVEHIIDGFATLPAHDDVAEGILALRARRLRLVTLSNGATSVARNVVRGAQIEAAFERLLSVDDAPAWKPARDAYEYAARVCEAPMESMLMVAAHPWDIDGAAHAGMSTAWINRGGAPYPAHFTKPDFSVPSIRALADAVR